MGKSAHKVPCFLWLLVALFTAAEAAPLMAQIVVYVDAGATGANDGTSWVDAYVDLQDALDDVSVPGLCTVELPCEIWVAAGTYHPSKPTDPNNPRTVTFELMDNVGIYGGFAGWETTKDQRAIKDPQNNLIKPAKNPAPSRSRLGSLRRSTGNETILSGDLNDDDDPTAEPTSNCCTERLNEGGCDDPVCEQLVLNDPDQRLVRFCDQRWGIGCVISALVQCCDLCRPTRCENAYHVVTARQVDAKLILDGLTVTGSFANAPTVFHNSLGAGLFAQETNPTVTDCTFLQNAGARGGGGINCKSCNPTVTGCTFVENDQQGMFYQQSRAVVSDSTFLRNRGLGMFGLASELTIKNCEFIENGRGGLAHSGDASVENCRFIRNQGVRGLSLAFDTHTVRDCLFIENEQGAMATSGLTEIINCGFYGNSTDASGGGLTASGTTIVANCVFSGNRAEREGGAIDLDSGGALILNSTFVRNHDPISGGILVGRSAGATISNCIFRQNTNDDGVTQLAQIASFPENPPNVSYCSIQGLDGSLGGVGNVDLDALFVDADGPDNVVGTEDDNLRLSVFSPLIDLGDPDPAVYARFDGDGHQRILCGRIDMGVYEFGIGDYDCDRAADLLDFSAFPSCMTGPTAEALAILRSETRPSGSGLLPAPSRSRLGSAGERLLLADPTSILERLEFAHGQIRLGGPIAPGELLDARDFARAEPRGSGAGCEAFDFNADGAIDLSDLAGFQNLLRRGIPVRITRDKQTR